MRGSTFKTITASLKTKPGEEVLEHGNKLFCPMEKVLELGNSLLGVLTAHDVMLKHEVSHVKFLVINPEHL